MTRIAQIFINYFFACFAPLREKVFLSKTLWRKVIFSFIISCLVSCFNYSFSQNNVVDSLNILLKTTTHDTTRLRLLVELSEECDPADILKYAKPAVELGDKLLQNISDEKTKSKVLYYQATVCDNIGIIYDKQGHKKEALDYYERSVKLIAIVLLSLP